MSTSPLPVPHPLGSRAKVLLSSVFGPYARDDEWGSRTVNPMELYQNQVTRVQGVFSLRMFHRSWGLMLMQANVEAPCAVLDFPTRERFVEELRRVPYDVVGIGSILPNIGKVEEMCRLVRRHRPGAALVVGGHIANKEGLRERVGADHVVRGDGVAWLRAYLGERAGRPVRHPLIQSGFATRCLGLSARESRGAVAATVIPSVGCPMGCNFCSTSAMFGGKGRFLNFYETGDELFGVMRELEGRMGVRSFFLMDENFLLYRPRALRLLERMRAEGKGWSLYVFSSANALRRYTLEELVALGVSWVWIGLEGEEASYAKLRRSDTRALVRELRQNGIRVLGSTIIGLPEHTPETLEAAIEHAVAHRTEFHQFMLYTPIPGTPLHDEHRRAGTLLGEGECPDADTHGQSRFNYRHPSLPPGAETQALLRAFQRDFEANGPSLVRIAETMLQGFLRHRHHPERRVRERYAWEGRELPTLYAGTLWAAERWYAGRADMQARMRAVRTKINRTFGLVARVTGPALGAVLLAAMRREERRLGRGWTYEPPTFYEVNDAAAALALPAWRRVRRAEWVAPCAEEAEVRVAARSMTPPEAAAAQG